MNHVRKCFPAIACLLTCFVSCYALADTVSPADFFSQVIATVQKLGGITWALKVSSIILLVVSSLKVSFINKYFWSKLGAAQAWVAPVLGLAAGLLTVAPVSGPAVFAYLSAGAGAVVLHELLDTIKAIPGIGQIYVDLINTIEGALGGPASQAMQVKK